MREIVNDFAHSLSTPANKLRKCAGDFLIFKRSKRGKFYTAFLYYMPFLQLEMANQNQGEK